MSESTQWQTIKNSLAILDPRRVDNSAGPGTPDVNYGGVIGGVRVEGWIELKWIRSWPVMDDTIIRVDHFTPQQKIWLQRRWKMGGVALLLLQVGREWFLFDGLTAAKFLGTLKKSHLIQRSIGYWPNGLDSGELLECLREISLQGNDSF